jgi:hypothetical protein
MRQRSTISSDKDHCSEPDKDLDVQLEKYSPRDVYQNIAATLLSYCHVCVM